jgi:zinc/manganese transport system permease protein
MIELLALPALACAALVAIHAYFGLHVLKRQVIFVDLALAQVAALGATVAFLLGYLPQSLAAHAYSLGFTLVAAAVLASTRTWSGRVPQEAQIGVIYVVSAAAALLLVERAPQGAEHIRQILTGNVLTVGWDELYWAIPLYAVVGFLYPRLHMRQPWLAEFAFYAAFGLVVTSSVAIAGVLLVFAFLIIPAAIGVLHANTFRGQLIVAWLTGTATALVGLAVSYLGDYATGATLVCTYGFALAIAAVAQALRMPQEKGAMSHVALRFARWLVAALLAASGIGVAIWPRADQPLLDAMERAFPAIRSAYMDGKAQAIAVEAAGFSERYRDDAAKLRAHEEERRWKGEPLDEVEVRRIGSFLKSYNEMIRGEEFVMREVRSRAREQNRWWISGILVLLALSLVVSLPSKRTTPRNFGGERGSIGP